MKRAVILHGTDASPDVNWFPWLNNVLKNRGYKVWIPHLPGNHTPNRKVYNDFLLKGGWDFSDNLIIGHSSGAVSVLNLLQDERMTNVDTAILVGAWSGMTDTDLDAEQFSELFPKEGFDFKTIKSKSKNIIFLHGNDDPYCPLNQAKWLAKQLDAPIKVIPKGHHLGVRFKELPELLDVLKECG